MKLALCLAFVALLAPQTAHATSAAVAVMPFHDLSGGKGNIGEAIRETVTSDLREVGGLKVIERSNLDKVLSEQNLQGKKGEIDQLTAVKVGKLVGATLLVAGAYQRAGNTVRLTARFVNVENGVLMGTAKVDGPQSDFLFLQDKVTSQLLSSAGMEQKKVQQFAARPRPKVKSLRTIELYGDAIMEPDDKKKRAILAETVKMDPGFVYASRDLDALEKRMREYGQVAAVAQDDALREEMKRIEQEIATEKDPLKVYVAYLQLNGRLMMAGRYRTLIAVSRKIIANPPPTPPAYASMGSISEQAQGWLIRSYEQLKDDDGMLRECEVFLRKYPASQMYSMNQMLCNVAIDRKRDKESGGDKAEQEIAALAPARRQDPCQRGSIYNSNKQFPKAKKELEACAANGGDKNAPWITPFLLVIVNYDLGHYADSRKWIEVVRTKYPDHYRDVRHFETMMPHEEK
ncbi:MAG: CsgG/HfaB family protein [Polyangia bacterium]